MPRSEYRQRERLLVTTAWLVRLRWVAVVGQLVTIAVVAWGYAIPLRMLPLLIIVGFTAVTNVVLAGAARNERACARHGHSWVTAAMLVDLLSLTALLYFSGGPDNPFVVFYFVNLALSAVVLPARTSWTLTAIAVAGCAALFAFHEPFPRLDSGALAIDRIGALGLTLRQQGLVVGLVACACVVVYFITRVTSELERRDAQLQLSQRERSRGEKLEALATLAAGAGHELATPLSTIAITSTELTRQLEDAVVAQHVLDDMRLIRDEVEHCRQILQRMAAGAGQASGEEVVLIAVHKLLETVLEGFGPSQRVRVVFDTESGMQQLLAPLEGLAQAIRGVVQNAIDASSPPQTVEIRATDDDGWLQLDVHDQGCGMTPEVLARAGEPFFTTKVPGEGMGLGLFLTRSVVERLGGTIEISSIPQRHTCVTLRLPLAAKA